MKSIFSSKPFLLVVGVGLIIVFDWTFLAPTEPKVLSSQTKVEVPKKFRASLEIEYGDVLREYTIIKELTVLEALKKFNKKVGTKGEGENDYVVSLDGRKADESKKEFWAFYVNGQMAQVGAGVYKIQNGDKIKWEIETY